MRGWIAGLLVVLAGCSHPPLPPVNDGARHLPYSGTFQCNGEPIALDGNHTDVTLEGPCTRVQIRGSHNDVVVYVVPGALVQITGSRNDVVWRLIQRGPPPRLENDGPDNNFHRNSRAPWQQDHDWWEERH